MKITTKMILGSIFFTISLVLFQLIGVLSGLDYKAVNFGSLVAIWSFIIFDTIMDKIIKKHYEEKSL